MTCSNVQVMQPDHIQAVFDLYGAGYVPGLDPYPEGPGSLTVFHMSSEGEG